MTAQLVEPSESGCQCRKHVFPLLLLFAGCGRAWSREPTAWGSRELPSWACPRMLLLEDSGWQQQGLGHWEMPA